ncbi:MAG: RHS repeat-associated core domain-containing protein [Nitrospira sp. CG24C]|nr:MAG: RHS repeat-associated core domain-containing protein [Nitrospira sp. CG24C]
MQYDANGNLTNDGTNTYVWDARNRLMTISGGVTASFVYDPLGRRTNKIVNSVGSQFLYDGNDVAAEIGGGAVGANYLRSLSIDEPFIRQSSAGNEHYHTDALGSSLLLSSAQGASATTYTYEPFGKSTMTGTSSNALQYTGREKDSPEISYYRARYYSPTRQRFMSEDPLKFRGGDLNLYGYVAGNPVSFVDPTGMLFGGRVNAGECFGDSAAQFWADMAESSGNALYYIPGALAALWTPGTSDDTFSTLALGAGASSLVKRAGTEWSHWIPSRYSNPASKHYKGLPEGLTENPLNGNYRSIAEHAMNDIFRARGMGREFMETQMNPFLLQQWNRLPDWMKGLGLAGLTQASKSKSAEACSN